MTPVIVAFNHRVFGIHPTSGQRLWRYEISSAGQFVRLAVAGDVVYALSGNKVACILIATGQVLGEVVVPGVILQETLLAAGDLLLVAGGGEVRCFSRNGQLLWEDKFKGEGVGDVALAYGGVVAQADRS